MTAIEEALIQEAWSVAVRLLARRDHSTAELKRKLRQREFSDATIQAVIVSLQEQNYVDDQRYALEFSEQRASKGYGPLSIQRSLISRGIEARSAREALARLCIDWPAQAEQTIESRFEQAEISDTSLQSEGRIARFMRSRGFADQDTLKALRALRKCS